MSSSEWESSGDEAVPAKEVVDVDNARKKPSVWQPRVRRINELIAKYGHSEMISLKGPLPNVDVWTDTGLGYGENYLSSYQLQAIDLPLHPLIYYFLYRTNFCLMQLHPNAFCLLSSALSLNYEYNWKIGLRDLFRCYKLIPCCKGKDLYTLARVHEGSNYVEQRKTTEKAWKNHAVIVSGEWKCGDLERLPIRFSFGDPGFAFALLWFLYDLTLLRVFWTISAWFLLLCTVM